MLWKILGTREDFQGVPQWAPLVVETARVLVETTGKGLVVPMTLVEAGVYGAIRRGFEGIAPTRHFALIASRETLAQRMTARGADPWAFAQIERCVTALAGPEFATHLDAEGSVAALAEAILETMM